MSRSVRNAVATAKILFLSVVLAGCGGGPSFPPWNRDDESALVYFVRASDGEAVVEGTYVNGSPVPGAGWPCDRRASVLHTPAGVLFPHNGGLYLARPGEEPTVLASLPSGVAREVQSDRATGEEVVVSWRVNNNISGLCLSPSGELAAFRVNQVLVPFDKTPVSKFSRGEIAAFSDPADFYIDEGVYVADLEAVAVRFVLPSDELLCFEDDRHLLVEQGLTVCRVDIDDPGDVKAVVAKDYFELGWTPLAASAGGVSVVLCSKAKPGSYTEILNQIYVLEGGLVRGSPAVTILLKERAAGVLVSPDGRYAAVNVFSGGLGGYDLYVADLDSGEYARLTSGAAVRFLPSSSGLVYFVEGTIPATGDLRTVGLDGASDRALTKTGDVVGPP